MKEKAWKASCRQASAFQRHTADFIFQNVVERERGKQKQATVARKLFGSEKAQSPEWLFGEIQL